MPNYPVAQQAWLAPPVDLQNQSQDLPRSNKVLFAVIGVAVALGVIITLIATRREASVSPNATASRDGAVDASAVAIVEDAVRLLGSDDAAPAGSVGADATPAGRVDASTRQVVDAAVAVAAIDAAVTAVDASVVTVPPDAPSPTLSEKIQRTFDEGRFSETVAACSERVPSERSAICTRAACELGQASKAKTWFGKVSSAKRKEVISACKQDGIDLVPAPVVRPPKVDAGVVDCLKEPMACQH